MSSTELIRAYLLERYRSRFFVPLAILLFAAGTYALGTRTTPIGAVVGVAAAYMAVLSFRIQDDIADRPVDRAKHPQRVTVRVNDLAPLKTVTINAMIIVIILLAFAPGAWVGLPAFALTIAVIALWYSLRDSVHGGRRLNRFVVIAKYPAIAGIAAVAGAASRPTSISIAAFGAMYVAACAYEFLHDRGVNP